MLVDLVRVVAADGLRLDGAFQSPPPNTLRTLPIEAVLLVHGTGANFYGTSLLAALAEAFLARGVAVLSANTRGHDIIHTAATSSGARLLGAALEVVDDCRHDLAAWIGLLRERGFLHVGIVGHSLGAIKGVYTLARADRPDVACLCAISPAWLSYERFVSGPQGQEFRTWMEKADRLVQEGKPDTLLDVTFPLKYLVTAAGYIDKYGPAERYNIQRHVAHLACPTLFVFGGQEVQEHVAFRGLPEALAQTVQGHEQIRIDVIAGGDHVYSGTRSELIHRIERWMAGLKQ
jgi:pimeloyl-ACP methyl ester carboxylesterase